MSEHRRRGRLGRSVVALAAAWVLAAGAAGCRSGREGGAGEATAWPVGAGATATAFAGYRIRCDDRVSVDLYSKGTLRSFLSEPNLVVDTAGRITLPMVGSVEVGGLTEAEARAKLEAAYSGELKAPVVRFAVVEHTGSQLYVLGEVKSPGAFELRRPTSSLEAVLLAGGFGPDADTHRVVVIRPAAGGGASSALDFKALLEQAELQAMVMMAPGDILYVPPVGLARTSRFHQHLERILSPYAMVIGTVGNILLWDKALSSE